MRQGTDEEHRNQEPAPQGRPGKDFARVKRERQSTPRLTAEPRKWASLRDQSLLSLARVVTRSPATPGRGCFIGCEGINSEASEAHGRSS
jgi:hypothetical protein